MKITDEQKTRLLTPEEFLEIEPKVRIFHEFQEIGIYLPVLMKGKDQSLEEIEWFIFLDSGCREVAVPLKKKGA